MALRAPEKVQEVRHSSFSVERGNKAAEGGSSPRGPTLKLQKHYLRKRLEYVFFNKNELHAQFLAKSLPKIQRGRNCFRIAKSSSQ